MPIKNRRQGREAALQSLYGMDVSGTSVETALENLGKFAELPEEILEFAERLINGVFETVDELDDLIEPSLIDWTIERLPIVDRNMIRIAVYELYHCPEIPPAVTINEAVTIIKKYSTAESGKFVNGVLGAVLKNSPKAAGRALVESNTEVEGESTEHAPDGTIEEIEIGSPRFEELAKAGGWTLRTDNNER